MAKKKGSKRPAFEIPDERPVVDLAHGSELTLDEFRRVAQTGAFERIVVESDFTHFTVRGEHGGRGGGDGRFAMLSKTRKGGVRKFLNPSAALIVLRKMGVVRVEVAMKEWDVEMASLTMRMRPDVTARRLQRQRTAHLRYFPDAKGPELGEPSRAEERRLLAEKHFRRKAMEARLAEQTGG